MHRRKIALRLGMFAVLTLALSAAVRMATGSWPILWWFGLIGLALLVEAGIVGWQRSSIRGLLADGSGSADLDFLYAALSLSGAMPFAIMALSLGASDAWGGWLTAHVGQPIQLHLPVAAEVFVSIFAGAVAQYGAHRLMHSRWLWPLHAMHHAADKMTILNAGRTHPVDLGIHGAFYAVPGVLLGFSDTALMVIPVVSGLIAFWQHSNLPNAVPFLEKWIVAGAANHAIHHAREARFHDRNFSDCPLIDRLFGTFAWSDERPEIGLDDGATFNQGIALIEPLRTQLRWLGVLSTARPLLIGRRAPKMAARP